MNLRRLKVTSRGVSPLFLLLRTRCVFTCFFLVMCQVFCVCGYREQKFAMEPQDQTAVVGSRVTLPCRVENKAGQLQWTKDDFGLGLHRDLSGYDRYKMIGSDEEGDYSLDIRDVTLDDDAKYQCQVSSGSKGEPAIRSRYARLTVLVPPEAPKIVQGKFISTQEDRTIKLECISAGGKPPAEITWVDSNGGVLTQGVSYNVEPWSDGQRFTATSVLKLVTRKDHNNQTYTCQAQNTADRAYRAASIIIEVNYAPTINMTVNGHIKGKTYVPEGHDARIACFADANPSNMTYKWYINNQGYAGNTTELVIPNVTRNHHETSVTCKVQNAIGPSEDTLTLHVTYAPTFRNPPKDVEAEIGTPITLSCDVDSFPEPEVEWYHIEEDQNIRIGKTMNLSLIADTHTSGRYLCKAFVEGYSAVQAEASVFIKGPPKIISNNTQFGTQGDTVNIECAAFSIPRIDNIIWTFEGKEIDSIHDQDYAFLEDLQAGGVINSTLIIRESQSGHFGRYKCNVSNDFGSDAMEIVLKPNKTFPLLLILFGVTSGMIMVAALIMLVILCQRKQRKNKQTQVAEKPDVTVTAEELFKDNDRNSNISDFKLELRQANGSCEVDYSNTGSDSTLCSNAKLGSIPTVAPLAVNQNYPYRYSNDYSDPAYADCYKVNGFGNGYQTYVHYAHDYTPGSLRVTSPTIVGDKLTPNRSVNGSLPRSIDTPSTVQFNPNSGSQNNSLQRTTKRQDSSNALNSLGLPNPEVNRIPNGGIIHGVDVRYAATYGNPHLRTGGGLGFNTVNTAKPASTPAPPPYSSVRSSVVLPSGNSSHSITSPTSLASPQCTTSPITTSTMSTDSTQPAIGVATSSGTPQSPSAHYILAPSTRTISNATVTKKGNGYQTPLATHV
ncbi:irregular chiasm C-roughest protein-like isoform X2 [Plodia interpunctella]|uniref:irregular chiasm C-roughest protein-like isoform X2 n=1 Tax=Plodia interpunctella TaxID=58824 RepID=UPI002367F99A|nr:irregular chiasm C-roughest protein-like isoform X2 [Plodia interpunctella]